MNQVQESLAGAALLLRYVGWVQGTAARLHGQTVTVETLLNNYDPVTDGVDGFCLLGAVWGSRVARGHNQYSSECQGMDWDVLAAAAHDDALDTWNDATGRTRLDVLDVLDVLCQAYDRAGVL